MNRLKCIGVLVVVVAFLPLLLAYLGAYLFCHFVWGAILRAWFWRAHAAQGRTILFVYSESPNWQSYIEANILPRIRDRAVILNWSERRFWSSASPWEARFFRRFSGNRNFNPLALVYCRRGRIKTVRFYQAFLDLKHGKDCALRAAESELFSLAEAAA